MRFCLLKVKQIESDKKKLELDVEAKKSQIEKYALQQFQTKKNEEYRALAHEIENAKAAIVKIEDDEIVLMEAAEGAAKEVVVALKEADEAKKAVNSQITDLDAREKNLKSELAELEGNRAQLTASIDESTLYKYQRLLKSKGENVIVGIEHGVCGGCHMRFPVQIIFSCQAGQELVTCPNCGRILYYTRDMDLAVAE